MAARRPPNIRIQGTRSKGYPAGYIVGRTDGGSGDLQLLGPRELRALGLASQSELNTRTSRAGFGFYAGGVLLDGETLGSAVFPFPVTFSDGNVDTSVAAVSPPTSTATFKMRVPVAGILIQIGQIVFTAGSPLGIVTWTGGLYVLPANTPISLVAPSPNDATLASVTGTVTGSK